MYGTKVHDETIREALSRRQGIPIAGALAALGVVRPMGRPHLGFLGIDEDGRVVEIRHSPAGDAFIRRLTADKAARVVGADQLGAFVFGGGTPPDGEIDVATLYVRQ